MSKLTEILKADTCDLTGELKRAFRPLSPPVEIDGKELDALTILVNLTDKTDDQKDLLDRTKCKQKLRDEKWWGACLKAVEYRHSHNIKFPDIRSDGVIRSATQGALPTYLLSSSKLPKHHWAYSRDSKYVNKAAFLTNEFSLNGSVSNLGDLLRDEEHPLWHKLNKLGCYQKTRKAAIKKLISIPQHIISVKLAPNYLTQISLPSEDDSYISLSPVTSQSMQSHGYQTLEKDYRYSVITRYSRSTNMGVLPMTCGGALRMIKSVPDFTLTPHSRINNNHNWLTEQNIRSLKQYQNRDKFLLPENQRKTQLKAIKNKIREMISAWLVRQNPATSINTLVQNLNYDLSHSKSAKRFAYEPSITALLHELVHHELIQTPLDNAVNDSAPVNTSFLVIPNIRVCGATALSSPVTVGIPSMTAFLGFTHAVERNLKETHPSLTIDSFAICIHQTTIEKRGLTKEFVQKSDESISAPATRDDWQCDLKFSVVLQLNRNICINERTVVHALPKRFARGSAQIAIADFEHINSFTTLKKAIKSIPQQNGKWLSLYTESINNLPDILSAIKENHRLTPTCVGYHFLEQPTEKPNSLRGYKHAFSEGIIGLIKPITFNRRTDIDTILWHRINHQNYISVQTRSISNGTTDKLSL